MVVSKRSYPQYAPSAQTSWTCNKSVAMKDSDGIRRENWFKTIDSEVVIVITRIL